jgi:hypothetical protein
MGTQKLLKVFGEGLRVLLILSLSIYCCLFCDFCSLSRFLALFGVIRNRTPRNSA